MRLLFAIVDIETTGSNKNFDRIFDIAIIKHDGQCIIEEFHTFVNPGITIPPFIEELTGISNEMVNEAPTFEEISDRILELTEDCVFVAHNVAFDYHFLRYEFKRLKIHFQRLQLCTVKLSQSAIPNLEAYSLGKLCASLNIPVVGRHTAYGDTKATSVLFEMISAQSPELVHDHIEGDFSSISLPNSLKYEELSAFPEDPGVVYFLNRELQPIYISDGRNIRKKTFDILRESGLNSRRKVMFNNICEVSYELSGNELIAKLQRTTEVLKRKPTFNKVRKRNYSHGIYLIGGNEHHPQLCLTNYHGNDNLLKAFMNKKSAIQLFKRICNGQAGNNFPRGQEVVVKLNGDLNKAIKRLTYPWHSFVVKGDGRHPGESSFVLIENRQYKGYGFVDSMIDASIHSIKDNLIEQSGSEEVKRTINSYLTKKRRKRVIPLS